MTSIQNDQVFRSAKADYTVGEVIFKPRAYRCHLAIVKDSDDLFSAIALNLPGAGSSGSTESEAIANARDAIGGVITEYLESDGEIPWEDIESYREQIPQDAKLKWILVNV